MAEGGIETGRRACEADDERGGLVQVIEKPDELEVLPAGEQHVDGGALARGEPAPRPAGR
jgi:hypothetical protein